MFKISIYVRKLFLEKRFQLLNIIGLVAEVKSTLDNHLLIKVNLK